ncbi:esterase-like activity of phytase family protein [Martelella endophytica]|uniref:Phytase-like domain-containing protein n=1 Tax=Martelella endophytica TaxID=1486262 RepID=A0A0D5LQ04_MAREN|nr:esterase-like activity of phytase family protein [Martelella endophytica]AJY46216.1 hypothetical protein TM49_11860 [Martelella endophytica]
MKRAAWLLALALFSAPATASEVAVSATPIEHFGTVTNEIRFGQLEYLGGMTLSGLHSISAIRFLPDNRSFIAVADDGYWIDGSITRDANRRLSGLTDVDVTAMKNAKGVHAGKSGMDAESLTIAGNRLLVGFEGKHRIDSYPLKGHDTATAKPGPDFLIPIYELRRNGSFEALATNADGRTVVIAEQSIDTDGNLFAAIVEGRGKGIFKVVKRQGFDVTDAAYLPDGNLLILERRFSLLAGVAMRIRLIDGDAIRAGAVVDGPVIMQANGGQHHIDNMEGMALLPMADGSLHLILVSDDNASPLQDTIMLEFKLL